MAAVRVKQEVAFNVLLEAGPAETERVVYTDPEIIRAVAVGYCPLTVQLRLSLC